MSPILVRPVREQLEHDRVVRLLQAKYKRKFDVAINPGNEQTAPVGSGTTAWYPDLVLQERGRKLGVMGTPNFFVAGKLVKKELTLEDIRAMVDPLLAGPATASAGAPN